MHQLENRSTALYSPAYFSNKYKHFHCHLLLANWPNGFGLAFFPFHSLASAWKENHRNIFVLPYFFPIQIREIVSRKKKNETWPAAAAPEPSFRRPPPPPRATALEEEITDEPKLPISPFLKYCVGSLVVFSQPRSSPAFANYFF